MSAASWDVICTELSNGITSHHHIKSLVRATFFRPALWSWTLSWRSVRILNEHGEFHVLTQVHSLEA